MSQNSKSINSFEFLKYMKYYQDKYFHILRIYTHNPQQL